jgi:Na+-translocating ferredoxin:NAD+ oxidoreductase RNF subunit RnfB
MDMILATVIVLAVVGLLVGLMLVFANETFAVETDPRETAVRECLPGNNCGACGQAGCDAMAAAIVRGDAPVNGCPVGGAAVAERVSAVMGISADAVEKRVAFVKCAGTCDKVTLHSNYVGIESCEAVAGLPGKGIKSCQFGCLGYGSCVKACQFDAIHVVDGVAQVDRSKCVACGKCVAACPQNIIELIPEQNRCAVQCSSREKGPVVRNQCDAGCIGCMLCTRVCQHDAVHVDGSLARIDYGKCVGCGKCAEKCPSKVIRML